MSTCVIKINEIFLIIAEINIIKMLEQQMSHYQQDVEVNMCIIFMIIVIHSGFSGDRFFSTFSTYATTCDGYYYCCVCDDDCCYHYSSCLSLTYGSSLTCGVFSTCASCDGHSCQNHCRCYYYCSRFCCRYRSVFGC